MEEKTRTYSLQTGTPNRPQPSPREKTAANFSLCLSLSNQGVKDKYHPIPNPITNFSLWKAGEVLVEKGGGGIHRGMKSKSPGAGSASLAGSFA